MRTSESGYVLVTVAALLFVLVGFAALALDMGSILSSRTQLQRAADAAALAGAFTFTTNPNATQDSATTVAKHVATSNKVMGDVIADADVAVSVTMPDPATDTPAEVSVTISRNEPMVFAKVLNLTGIPDKVTATAESGVQARSARCVKPFFVSNTALSSLDPCDAASAGQMMISSNQITTYAKNNFGVTQITLKPSDPNQALRPGDFYELDINGGGASGYSDHITFCNSFALVCRNTYDVLTGNKIGPTVKGVQDLIGNPPTDAYVGIGQYSNSNGTFDTSRALILAPIMDLAAVPNFCPAPVGTCTDKCEQFPSGSNVSIQVIGFALIFIENANGGNVTGRLVNVFPCGANTPSADDYGSVAVALRLIHK